MRIYFFMIGVFFLGTIFCGRSSKELNYQNSSEYIFDYPTNLCLPDSLGGNNIKGFVYYQIHIDTLKKITFRRIISINASNVVTGETIKLGPQDTLEFKSWEKWTREYVAQMSAIKTPKVGIGIILTNAIKLDSICS